LTSDGRPLLVRSGGSAGRDDIPVNSSESASHALAPRPPASHNARISSTPDDVRRFLTENLPLLQQVVRRVAHRHRLRGPEVEELLGAVQLKLIENDYEAIRRFEGRSSLATYFRSIVTRHLIDERTARWGKWRPSLFARRRGAMAMQLEMLMTRDRLPFDEAVQVLRSNHHVVESEEELYRLSLGFPARAPRRFVDAAVLDRLAVHDATQGHLDDDRRAVLAARTGAALQAALAALDSQDRLLLKMHFVHNLPLSKIAQVLQVEPKPLYRRKDQVLALLGRELARQGLQREDIMEVLGEDLDLTIGADDAMGKAEERPSK
jgi:RNA polymerase sigma factor for flagellar operon FliA